MINNDTKKKNILGALQLFTLRLQKATDSNSKKAYQSQIDKLTLELNALEKPLLPLCESGEPSSDELRQHAMDVFTELLQVQYRLGPNSQEAARLSQQLRKLYRKSDDLFDWVYDQAQHFNPDGTRKGEAA